MPSRVFGSSTAADKHASASHTDAITSENDHVHPSYPSGSVGRKGFRSVLGFSSSSSRSSSNPVPSATAENSFKPSLSRSSSRATLKKERRDKQPHEFTSGQVSGSRRSVDVVTSSHPDHHKQAEAAPPPPSSFAYSPRAFSSATSLSLKQTSIRDGRASLSEALIFFQSPASASASPAPSPSHLPASAPSTPKRQHTAPLPPSSVPALPSASDLAPIELNSPDKKLLRPGQKPRSNKMVKQDLLHERAGRKKLARLEAQDGPWSVSVAESPYDLNQFSVYIKTPTHHMTLTRTAQEILDLNRKLTAAHPDLNLPEVPLHYTEESVSESPLDAKKRKSSFLHTLSRLASPGPSKRERPRDTKIPSLPPSSRNSKVSTTTASTATTQGQPQNNSTISSTLLGQSASGTATTPNDTWERDPFSQTSAADGNSVNTFIIEGGSATSTALASYLTTLANEPALKRSKAWRRFVRVRTDDLISERVERTVKRVRSDLAAHLSGTKRRIEMRDDVSLAGSAVLVDIERDPKEEEDERASNKAETEAVREKQSPEVNGDVESVTSTKGPAADISDIKEEDEEENRTAENEGSKKSEEAEATTQDQPGTPKPTDVVSRASMDVPAGETSASTPKTETNAAVANRIPRSQSADPDKAARMSRQFQEQVAKLDADDSAAEYESEAQVETEVEEGKSTTTVDDDSSISTTDANGLPRLGKRSKSGARKVKTEKPKVSRKVLIDDFEMMRVLGKGCAGKVLLVRHKKSEALYALKAITKRHVLAHQELQHTLTEQAVLKRMAREAKDPFVVRLWWSFHDKDYLFLVMDFHPGGDLATQLARWGRLSRDRARFYAAEIVEGVDGLHAAGVIYRDLKPENILIGADGHIVLTDFGLSKEFPRRTSPITAPATPSGSRSDFHLQQPIPHWMSGEDKSALPFGQNDSTGTFCGTAEYLAPEVIQGQQYSYEVDWWSFGTMLYEMLTGITPFWANNHSDMYVRVLQDELKFPDDRVLDQDTKSLIRGLLQRNPALRMKQPRIKRHPYFSMIDWSHVYYKRYIPPYIPPIDPLNASDTQNFDDTFLDMEPVIADENDQNESGDASERTDGEEEAPAESRDSLVHPPEEEPDVFDGYSFKGRQSVLIEDEDDVAGGDDEDEDEEDLDEDESIQRLANANLGAVVESEKAAQAIADETEEAEPKTPEARKSELPNLTPAEEIAALHRAAIAATEALDAEDVASSPSKSIKTTEAKENDRLSTAPSSPLTPLAPAPPRMSAELAAVTKHADKPAKNILTHRGIRSKKEKSGIPALDKYLSDGGDDVETERDEDDDWDFIEALPVGAEDRNGAKNGTSLFARGVVDRYKLAVFRKTSTPSKATPSQRRNVSGLSANSDKDNNGPATSPSPSEKQRRGRNSGLTFRRTPRQFLRARSPPPTASQNGIAKAINKSNSQASGSASTAQPNTLKTQPSTVGPSLKSKGSSTSVGSPNSSDDQSLNGEGLQPPVSAGATSPIATQVGASETSSATASETSIIASSAASTVDGSKKKEVSGEDDVGKKNKKLKKYKNDAKNAISQIFSPRP